jgi:hypothetical protein
VLWGPAATLQGIRARTPADIDPSEGVRLLANRAAGLLLATQSEDPEFRRIQASKALLASLDAELLARGIFAPSQLERWSQWEDLLSAEQAAAPMDHRIGALTWAIRYKTDPGGAPAWAPESALQEAAISIWEALPTAIRAAGLTAVDDVARADSRIDNAVYLLRHRAQGLRPGAHASGHLRAATLELMADHWGLANLGRSGRQRLQALSGGSVSSFAEQVAVLDRLRGVVPQ